MKRRMLRARYPLLVLFLVTMLGFGLVLFAGPFRTAQAGAPVVPPPQKPDNSACLACHAAPGQSYTLPSGEVLGISIDPNVYDQSTHTTLACQTCHPNIAGFPHPQNTAQDSRAYTLEYEVHLVPP